MSIVFIEGFDHYTLAQMPKKWTTVTLVGTFATPGRFGGQAMNFNSVTMVEKVFPATSPAWRIGFAFMIGSTSGSAVPLVLVRDGGTNQCELNISGNTTRNLFITRNGTQVGSTGTTPLVVGAWYYVEWYVSIKDVLSAGNCQVYLNGVQELNITTGDTKNTANAFADRVQFAGGAFWNYNFDDVVISQEIDTTTPTFLGDRRVVTLYPNGDGNYSQFVGSDGNSVNNSLLVDETILDESDYVTTDVVGNKDSYAMSNLPLTPTAIDAVQITGTIRKDDAGSRVGRLFSRIGGTDYESGDKVLSSTSLISTHLMLTDPSTSAAWTATNVNAMEAGIKIQS